MHAELALRSPTPAGRWPNATVGLRTARKALRSGVLWGFAFGLTVASSALGYASAYKTPAQRERFAALFTSNAGLAAINGPAHGLYRVAGYTAWKSFMTLIVVGSVWGLLAGARLMRGEEDAGRWELLLAGQTTPRRAAGQALAGLGAGLVALWTLTALITVAVGRFPKVHIAAGPALYFATALVAAPAMFLAAGALASQLAATRRQAASYAGAALGLAYALRLLADSGTGLTWLRWVSPLGWVEALRPLALPRPLAFLPIAGLTALLGGLALWLAGRRDLGEGVLADRSATKDHLRLVGGPLGLAARLVRPAVAGWAAGIGAMALVMGLVAKQSGGVLTSSPSVEGVVSRLGVRGAGAADYLGFVFLMVAVMVALLAAGQVSAARGEEADGRVDHLVVRPVSRSAWLAGRVGLATAAVLAAGLIAGLFAWLGAASQGSGAGFGSLLEAGINLAPPALFILGVGVCAMGLWPRAATAVTYGVLAWSFLVEVVGASVNASHWLLDTSVLHQMAPSPAVAPDWASAGALVALGAVAAVVGGVAFARRDLAGE
ncbi:MAG: hypothetical protein ACYDH5_08715 [Acidimicrobiales bacterium]